MQVLQNDTVFRNAAALLGALIAALRATFLSRRQFFTRRRNSLRENVGIRLGLL
jgi:hypothetical protein